MTALESRVMGIICSMFGIAFGLLGSGLAFVFGTAAVGFFGWTIYKDFSGGGGGPHTLKPA